MTGQKKQANPTVVARQFWGQDAAPVRWCYRQVRSRQRIHQLKRHRPGKPIGIIIGAARAGQRGWLSTDEEFLNLLRPEDWRRFFDEGTIQAILAEHVWEHLNIEEGCRAAKLCFRYLRPGGYVRVAVPDGLHPDPGYVERVRPGGTGSGAVEHKVLYTYHSLTDVFRYASFEVVLLEYFDETGSFHRIPWDTKDGLIQRSSGSLNCRSSYTSLIADMIKPIHSSQI